MSMKKRKVTGHSALGLIASGLGTISINQKMPVYRLRTTKGALAHDAKAISGDARRALTKAEREYA